MDMSDEVQVFSQMDMKEYRKEYKKQHDEFMKTVTVENIASIEEVVVKAPSLDMNVLRRMNPKSATAAIDRFYANDGRFLDLRMTYPPSMIDSRGKEYTINARSIYYRNNFSQDFVTCTRKGWVPSLAGLDWNAANEQHRRERADVLVSHNIRSEMRRKSEYAWEADAWSDVFGGMREDICLEMDKHDYYFELAKTDRVRCTLTGETELAKRTTDATFGLTPFSIGQQTRSFYADELRRDRLEKLLLHRKCGLISDPNLGEIDLVFPFAVYEAKGWSGDYREARHQACTTAAAYLDMLDNLGRTPGPPDSAKPYQTTTSHQYQVFVLTSFGSHWHILVGYRRPRQKDEFAGERGISDVVYVFQRIWSGSITYQRSAWELLSLVDQIHVWAKTDFRTFVIDHLRPWHKFCDDNYLLDWDSVYGSGQQQKRKRDCREDQDLPLLQWTNLVSEPHRQKIQDMAKRSLKKAIKEYRLLKGERKAKQTKSLYIGCLRDECGIHQNAYFTSSEAWLEHLKSFHNIPDEELLQLKHCLDEAKNDDSGGTKMIGSTSNESGYNWILQQPKWPGTGLLRTCV